jgi:ABC-2 type transport system ATP-binding protein
MVSYLPDRNYLPDWMKTKELLDMYEDFFTDFDRSRAINMLNALSIDLEMPLKKMSKGTKEKVQLILTMSRHAKLYLLDEPIAGVDPAARDFILKTIISNYDENATVLISTHLIADVENVLDEAIFLKEGRVVLHQNVDELRDATGKSVDEYFREVFKC